jgi:Fic family protein
MPLQVASMATKKTHGLLSHLFDHPSRGQRSYADRSPQASLSQEQVAQVIGGDRHFPGRERDQNEVKGYYAALDEAERLAKRREKVTEGTVQKLHALVMGGGKTRVRSTPYRDGQNVIRDGHSKGIICMPPEAKDVPWLMEQLVTWINQKDELSVPIRARTTSKDFTPSKSTMQVT